MFDNNNNNKNISVRIALSIFTGAWWDTVAVKSLSSK